MACAERSVCRACDVQADQLAALRDKHDIEVRSMSEKHSYEVTLLRE